MSKGMIVHSSSPADLWNDDAIKTQLLGVPPAPDSGRR
jgi:hypothetical protein